MPRLMACLRRRVRTGPEDCKRLRPGDRPAARREPLGLGGGERARRDRRRAARARRHRADVADHRRRPHRASRPRGTCASAVPDLGIVLLEAGVLGQRRERPQRRPGAELGERRRRPTDPEAARRIHAATRAGIDLAEALAARYAPPGTFRRQGCLEVYTDPRRAEAARARASSELRAAGIPARVPAGAASSASQGAHGAVLDPLAGRLNGFALLQALRPALVARGRRGPRAHAGAPRARAAPRSRSRRRRARCARAPSCSRPTPTRRRSASSAAASCRCTRTCSRRRRSPTTRWARARLGPLGRLHRRPRPHRLRLPHAGRPAALRRRRQPRLHLSLRRRRRSRGRARGDARRALHARARCALLPGARRRADRAALGRHARASPSTASARWACGGDAPQRLPRARLQRARRRPRAARRPRARRPLRGQPRGLARPALLPEAPAPDPARAAALARLSGVHAADGTLAAAGGPEPRAQRPANRPIERARSSAREHAVELARA